MKKLDKSTLEILYVNQQKTPVEIGEYFQCDHKTVRKYLRLHRIPLRPASEYNYLARKTHESPTDAQLKTLVSIKGHIAYLCEGWHTEKTTCLNFCNTDPLLINVFVSCLQQIYKVGKYRSTICASSSEEAEPLFSLHPHSKLVLDKKRITPIVRINAGGVVLAREFIANAYYLLSHE